MKRLVLLLLVTSLVFAQCVNNGICDANEKAHGCPDCSFGSVCVDDGKCTNVENDAGCSDCSSVKVVKCIDDGACSEDEKGLGNCSDCQPKSPTTGFILLAGGIGLIGFLVVMAIVMVVLVLYGLNHMGNRRIRM